MTNILDQVARSSSSARYGQFQPSDQREYFALRLAQKLDDAAAARHYGELLEHYSEDQLLVAYRRARSPIGLTRPGAPAGGPHARQ